tara:strand:+ start:549 stop:752 length:204 start_codon:yes stop_codon:yes gene_type:complete
MTTKQEHDALTGETVVRDMTADETKLAKLDKAEADAYDKDEAAKATAKAALLDRLGITADEAELLLG